MVKENKVIPKYREQNLYFLQVKSGEKPYHCEVCGKAFTENKLQRTLKTFPVIGCKEKKLVHETKFIEMLINEKLTKTSSPPPVCTWRDSIRVNACCIGCFKKGSAKISGVTDYMYELQSFMKPTTAKG